MRNGSPSCAPARPNEALGFDRCAPAAHHPSREFDRTRPRAKVFLSTPASARRMTDPSASPLAKLESAVLHSRSDHAAAATVDAIRAKVPLQDVVRSTAHAFASHYDGASGVAPRSLVALSSAWNLLPALQPRFHALPVLQAGSFGFKEVRLVLRPAVQYLVSGPRDRAAFETILAALGKEWVDLDTLASGGRPLDEGARTKVRDIAAAPNPSSCIAATLALLREGYAAVSIAEGLAVEAAKRVVAANGYDLDSARGGMFTHAARFVLNFSRTSERVYALVPAALRGASA